jgi:hypothetical protein
MSEMIGVSNDLCDLWIRLKDADTTYALRISVWPLVKQIYKEQFVPAAFIDLVLAKCSVRPLILSEPGLRIVMIASEEARETFRARLVECGMFLEAMRLASIMERSLSRAEVVALGNYHLKSIDISEVEKFIICAMHTEGMQPLDLRRIYKQFGVEVRHLNL